jgi:DNA-binding transcriptional ArsR family regulator
MATAISDETAAMSKALSHPLRVRILRALDGCLRSPNELSIQLDEPLGNVSYHVKQLEGFGCVELAKTEPRRGAVEHFYRSTGKAVVGGLTISGAQAKLAAEALDWMLVETENDDDGEVDGAGYTREQRAELFELQELFASAQKPA